jgi:DNA-3-methyladenine glycosylase II
MNNKEIIKGIQQLSENDSVLAKIIEKAGRCNLKPHKDYFKSFLDSIIGQQLSMRVAEVISGRFMNFFENKPTPEKILAAADSDLRMLGLSAAKTKYVKDLSDKILKNEISFENLAHQTDEELISEFTKVKGIGVWTTQMFLIFTLGRLNVLPVLDLGIKRAIMINYKLKTLPDEKKIIALAKRKKWAPYCSIACWYLWRSLEFKD